MRVRRLIDLLPSNSTFEYQGDAGATFRGFSGDTGKDVRGRFYCLRRANIEQVYGAHDEPLVTAIEDAFHNGATGVVCPPDLKGSPYLEGRNVFFTDTVVRFRAQVAQIVRRSLRRSRIIAVTGSAGKSTTKSMAAHALRAADSEARVHALKTNQNMAAHVVAQVSRSHNYHYTVIEASSGIFRWLDRLSFTISPDVAIITTIAEAHLELHGDLEGVARAKSGLLNNPPAGGVAVINLDTAHSDLLIRKARDEGAHVVTYGEDPSADVSLVSYDLGRSEVVAGMSGEHVQYTLGAEGKHMALNSLAVIATLRALEVEGWRAGVDSLASFGALSGRGRDIKLRLGPEVEVTLLDESYNANPASIRASLSHLSGRSVPADSRRVAVLGDVLELGRSSDAVHRALAPEVKRAALDEVHLFGEEMSALYSELNGDIDNLHHWDRIEDLSEALLARTQDQDLILVKGSQATGLNSLVKDLTMIHQDSV